MSVSVKPDCIAAHDGKRYPGQSLYMLHLPTPPARSDWAVLGDSQLCRRGGTQTPQGMQAQPLCEKQNPPRKSKYGRQVRLRLTNQAASLRCSWLLGVTSSCRPITLCCLPAVGRVPLLSRAHLSILTAELQPWPPSCHVELLGTGGTCGTMHTGWHTWDGAPGMAHTGWCMGDSVPLGFNQPQQLAGAYTLLRRAEGLFGIAPTAPQSAMAAPASYYIHLPKDRINRRCPVALQVPQSPAPLLCSWDAHLLALERRVRKNGK